MRTCGVGEWLWYSVSRGSRWGVGSSMWHLHICRLCRGFVDHRGDVLKHMWSNTLDSVFEPPGNTNLGNFIITLAQPATDGILTLAGLVRAKGAISLPPRRLVGLEKEVISLRGSAGLSFHSRLLHTPIYRVAQMALSVEQGLCCTWPWWWVDEEGLLSCLAPPVHRRPAATQRGLWGWGQEPCWASCSRRVCCSSEVNRREIGLTSALFPQADDTGHNRPCFSERCDSRMEGPLSTPLSGYPILGSEGGHLEPARQQKDAWSWLP